MLLSVLMALAGTIGGADSFEIKGRCLYPQAFDAYRDAAVLAVCNAAELRQDAIEFTWNGELQMRYSGNWSGDEFEVDKVRLRSGRTFQVEGVCRLDYANGDISNLACLANNRGLAMGANLVVTGI